MMVVLVVALVAALTVAYQAIRAGDVPVCNWSIQPAVLRPYRGSGRSGRAAGIERVAIQPRRPGKSAMSEPAARAARVRARPRLLLVQLTVAILVFGALTYASMQLNDILKETAAKQAQLQEEHDRLSTSLQALEQGLKNARDATPIVRNAIIAFHNRRYEEAIDQYQEALRLDPGNSWVRDLLGYSQYMAGRAAQAAGQAGVGARRFDDAVGSVRQVLREAPDYIGGYVELAIYECARGQPDAAVAAHEAAVARFPDADREFTSRLDEIPQRCTALRRRLSP
jgi:tetratricopeptide (TPR) repeat protein